MKSAASSFGKIRTGPPYLQSPTAFSAEHHFPSPAREDRFLLQFLWDAVISSVQSSSTGILRAGFKAAVLASTQELDSNANSTESGLWVRYPASCVWPNPPGDPDTQASLRIPAAEYSIVVYLGRSSPVQLHPPPGSVPDSPKPPFIDPPTSSLDCSCLCQSDFMDYRFPESGVESQPSLCLHWALLRKISHALAK